MNQSEIRAELATAYAAGVLDDALTLLVETQSAIAPAGGRILDMAEAVAGVAPAGERHAPLRADALERVLAKIDAAPDEIAQAAKALTRGEGLMEEVSHLPGALQDATIRALSRRKWRRPLRGVHALELDVGSYGGKVELIRIEPGLDVPLHTHSGPEYALVLTGSYSDGAGRHDVGDVGFADPDVIHRPRADSGPICWTLVVTYGALRWRDALGLARRILLN